MREIHYSKVSKNIMVRKEKKEVDSEIKDSYIKKEKHWLVVGKWSAHQVCISELFNIGHDPVKFSI